MNIGPCPDGTILRENVETLKEVGDYLKSNGFPKLNTNDYMYYRTKVIQQIDKEKRESDS